MATPRRDCWVGHLSVTEDIRRVQFPLRGLNEGVIVIKRVDRFGNPVNVGDIIAYYGTNVGMVVGVVVKLNPKSYKVMSKSNYNGKDNYRYYNILFEDKLKILSANALINLNSKDILNDIEKVRLGLVT